MEIPICPICKVNPLKPRPHGRWSKYCSRACCYSDPKWRENSTKHLNTPEKKAKRDRTNKERYGGISPFSSEKVREKKWETIEDRYGSKEKMYQQITDGLIEKYGGRGTASEELLDRMRKTMKERYGFENYNQLPEAKAAQSERSKEIIKKSIATQIARYGCMWGSSPEGVVAGLKRFKYKDLRFDSSWELYFYIWCEDNEIPVKRNKQYFKYEHEGKQHRYYPDFEVNGRLVEIKGDHLKRGAFSAVWEEKFKICEENCIIILSQMEMRPIIQEVIEKHGKDYVPSFQVQKQAKPLK